MRLVRLLFVLVFAAMAFVQRNDPDPSLWIAFYAAMAACCGISVLGKPPSILVVVLAAWAGWLASAAYPGFQQYLDSDVPWADTMSDEHPYIEEAREFGGLCIAGLGLLITMIPTKPSTKKKPAK